MCSTWGTGKTAAVKAERSAGNDQFVVTVSQINVSDRNTGLIKLDRVIPGWCDKYHDIVCVFQQCVNIFTVKSLKDPGIIDGSVIFSGVKFRTVEKQFRSDSVGKIKTRAKRRFGRSDGLCCRGVAYGLPFEARLMRAKNGSPLRTFLCGRAEGVGILSS